MAFLDELGAFIASKNLLDPHQPVVVGVSGGPDSLCLLDSLHRLGHPVVVAHFDHGLRPESGEEAGRVQHMAAERGLPFEVERWGDSRERFRPEGSLEAAARHARYLFLLRVAIEKGIHRVATGHTADDQVETLLMNLLRGAGPDGLRGMAAQAPIGSWAEFGPVAGIEVTLIRPLLAFGRGQTEAYCDRHGLAPVFDPSNEDRRFLRNRVRHELLPALETYNPEVRAALLRMSLIMGDVAGLMATLVEQAWTIIIREAGESAMVIDAAGFADQPVAIQRRLVRRAFGKLAIETREAGFLTIERLRSAMLDGRTSRLSITAGVDAERVGGDWVLSCTGSGPDFPEFPLLGAPGEVFVPDSGPVVLASGWSLVAERMESTEIPSGRLTDARCVVFDRDQLTGPLVLRPARAGERLEPFGMSGSTKLSDIFVDLKIPRRVRRQWPVLADNENVLWLVGLRRGKAAAVGPETRHLMQVTLVPPDGQG